jgi:hypothetical protein
VYGKPVSELFAGLSDSVEKDSRRQMKRLQARLQANSEAQSPGRRIMQKFQWISQRLLEMPNFKLVSV